MGVRLLEICVAMEIVKTAISYVCPCVKLASRRHYCGPHLRRVTSLIEDYSVCTVNQVKPLPLFALAMCCALSLISISWCLCLDLLLGAPFATVLAY